MDRISGEIRPFFSYPVSGRIPDFKKTGYPVSEYPAGYPANRILVWHFYSCLKIWDVSIIWVTLSNNEQALKYPVSGRISGRISGIRHPPDIRYPAPTGYPAEYPVSGFQNGRISGKTAIRSIPIPNHCHKSIIMILGMDRIVVLPDIRPTGYPAILKTGYRIFQTSTELLRNP